MPEKEQDAVAREDTSQESFFDNFR